MFACIALQKNQSIRLSKHCTCPVIGTWIADRISSVESGAGQATVAKSVTSLKANPGHFVNRAKSVKSVPIRLLEAAMSAKLRLRLGLRRVRTKADSVVNFRPDFLGMISWVQP